MQKGGPGVVNAIPAGFELRSFEHQSETDAIKRMLLAHKFEILKM